MSDEDVSLKYIFDNLNYRKCTLKEVEDILKFCHEYGITEFTIMFSDGSKIVKYCNIENTVFNNESRSHDCYTCRYSNNHFCCVKIFIGFITNNLYSNIHYGGGTGPIIRFIHKYINFVSEGDLQVNCDEWFNSDIKPVKNL